MLERLKNIKYLPGKLKELIEGHPVAGFLVIFSYIAIIASIILETVGVISEGLALIVQTPVIIMLIVMTFTI